LEDEIVEARFTVEAELDGEFSLFDAETDAFMSHYVTVEDVIERFKNESALDKWTYTLEVMDLNGTVIREIVIVPAA
jgi:hypothetical protein